MEARQTLRGNAVPKGLTILIAVSVAAALAGAAAVITKDLSGSSATVNSTVHAAPGTVLRQDSPAQSNQVAAPARGHRGRTSGSQSIADNQPASTDSGMDRNSGRLAPGYF